MVIFIIIITFILPEKEALLQEHPGQDWQQHHPYLNT